MDFHQKYLKYKNKYIGLSNKYGGGNEDDRQLFMLHEDDRELFMLNEDEKNFLNNNFNEFKELNRNLDNELNERLNNNKKKFLRINDEEYKNKKNFEELEELKELNRRLDKEFNEELNNKKEQLLRIINEKHENLKNRMKQKFLEENNTIYNDIKQRRSIILSDHIIKNSIEVGEQDGGGKGKRTWARIIADLDLRIWYDALGFKISSLSSSWGDRNPESRYAGIIFWHKNDSHMINQAKNIRSIYFLIQDTQKWEGDSFRDQGGGRVHNHLYNLVTDTDLFDTDGESQACSSGFSLYYDMDEHKYVIKFSSVYLNSNQNPRTNNIPYCHNNGSKATNFGEFFFILKGIQLWMEGGPGHVIKIEYLNELPGDYNNNRNLVDNFVIPLDELSLYI